MARLGGLAMHRGLRSPKRVARAIFQHAALAQRCVHGKLVKAVCATALPLGPVKRDVRGAKQIGGTAAVLREQRNADTGADTNRLATQAERSRKRLDQPCRKAGSRLRLVGASLQDDELVAADARRDLRSARDLSQSHCDLLQQQVSRGVAQGVVDGFEPVEVEAQHC